jgi:hypothetical protein
MISKFYSLSQSQRNPSQYTDPFELLLSVDLKVVLKEYQKEKLPKAAFISSTVVVDDLLSSLGVVQALPSWS